MRQMHHWAADIFIGSIVVHMARIFFTGAFRKPRELNWTIGITMLILAILERLHRLLAARRPDLGHRPPHRLLHRRVDPPRRQLPGDLPLGRPIPGHRHHHPALLHHPRPDHPAGPDRAALAPTSACWCARSTRSSPGEGRTENNVVGSPMFPTFMAKTTGFLFMVTAATALLGGLRPDQPDLAVRPLRRVQDLLRRPAGLVHGLARRRAAHHAVVGVGRLGPHRSRSRSSSRPWSSRGSSSPSPCCGRPSSAKFTRDNAMHNLLDRPRDRPKRTAAGVGHASPCCSRCSPPARPTCWPTSSTSR